MNVYRYFTVEDTRLPCLLRGSLALLMNMQYVKRANDEIPAIS